MSRYCSILLIIHLIMYLLKCYFLKSELKWNSTHSLWHIWKSQNPKLKSKQADMNTKVNMGAPFRTALHIALGELLRNLNCLEQPLTRTVVMALERRAGSFRKALPDGDEKPRKAVEETSRKTAAADSCKFAGQVSRKIAPAERHKIVGKASRKTAATVSCKIVVEWFRRMTVGLGKKVVELELRMKWQ